MIVRVLMMFAMLMVSCSSTLVVQPQWSTAQELETLNGDWIYVEDKTEGRPMERLGPPMASSFSLKVEGQTVILNGHGSGHKDVKIALDGSVTEVKDSAATARYQGAWKDGTFAYDVNFERAVSSSNSLKTVHRSFRMTPEGLLVTVTTDPPIVPESIAIYRQAEDIALPEMAKATIADAGWLAGNWVGTRSSGSSIEERWSPPLGGAMLATSRTVNTSGQMVAFEYLRIVERDGGLVYIAQPAGRTPTEFYLTALSSTRAVFDNPRHDYPKRIVYELSAEGELSATTGYLIGGTPRRFEFKREE
ncbi:MAG: hypothetical protein JNL67_06975 [Planctomycetaceae bacterium]|nr:hypothetical protein [Planctomycetaceae bacterium]